MKDISEFSDVELAFEVNRRAQKRKENPRPKPKTNINWEPLVGYLENSMNQIDNKEGEPKDFEHWIFEIVMETVYGDNVWKWWNDKT